MSPPAFNPDFLPFDLETGMRVASKVGNLHSKFGPARPLGSRIIRYVRGGRTDRWTDGETDGQKQRLLPLPYGRSIIVPFSTTTNPKHVHKQVIVNYAFIEHVEELDVSSL